MAELEELIAGMKMARRFDLLEMEFIHTRAKGVLQLLQILEQREEPVMQQENPVAFVDTLKEKVKAAVHASVSVQQVADADAAVDLNMEEEQEEEQAATLSPEPVVKIDEPEAEADEHISAVEPRAEEDKAPVGKEEEVNQVVVVRQEEEVNQVVAVRQESGEELLLENNHHAEAGSTLGESFLKGKSLGDMITEQVKLEFKLSNRPVSSIQSSIGINDRFQYIRELFDGDNRKFTEAVKTLDSMHNVKEAVEYLRTNFKWKKNETSLKFVNLVKRRFQNPVNG